MALAGVVAVIPGLLSRSDVAVRSVKLSSDSITLVNIQNRATYIADQRRHNRQAREKARELAGFGPAPPDNNDDPPPF